jgi:hypothetical protein
LRCGRANAGKKIAAKRASPAITMRISRRVIAATLFFDGNVFMFFLSVETQGFSIAFSNARAVMIYSEK